MAQPVWSSGCPTRSKTGKKHNDAFFACFRPYIQQSDNHVGWATLMPFATIYLTDPRTNLWNFAKKYWGIFFWRYFFWRKFLTIGEFVFWCHDQVKQVLSNLVIFGKNLAKFVYPWYSTTEIMLIDILTKDLKSNFKK